jgi:PPM family protein phosphatase
MRVGAHTTTGNYRENNEDFYHVGEELGLYIVADGMGGQAAGERASHLAVDVMVAELAAAVEGFQAQDGEPSDDVVSNALHQAVRLASQRVRSEGQADPDLKDMGTTVVVVWLRGDKAVVTWLGDSRIYLFRGGETRLLTVDQSLAQALVDAGTIKPEEVETHYFRNVLWRFAGAEDLGDDPAVSIIPTVEGDRFLLATDGLTGVMSDEEIGRRVAEHDDPDVCCDRLVAAALEAGSKDNVTCLGIFL